MQEALSASIVLVLLVISAGFGIFGRHRRSERHRSQETANLVGLAITKLVTFAALVMSLLIYSGKGAFDEASKDMGMFAAHIVQLDPCLSNYGPETAEARNELRFYTAEVIATTWHGEQAPTDAGKLLQFVSNFARGHGKSRTQPSAEPNQSRDPPSCAGERISVQTRCFLP